MSRKSWLAIVAIGTLLSVSPVIQAAPRKAHVVVLGAARKVAYSKAGDPAGAAAGETELKIRALMVDGVLKEWTTGDAHDVTDRSFVVRRAIKLNDALPGDNPGQPAIPRLPAKPHRAISRLCPPAKPALVNKPSSEGAQQHWVWQRGPWLLVDRVTGHIIALKLPDYDPGVSQVSLVPRLRRLLRRDRQRQKPLCRRRAGGGAQGCAGQKTLGLRCRRATPSRSAAPPSGSANRCASPFIPPAKEAASFDVVPGSAVLVEDAGDEEKQDTGKKD